MLSYYANELHFIPSSAHCVCTMCWLKHRSLLYTQRYGVMPEWIQDTEVRECGSLRTSPPLPAPPPEIQILIQEVWDTARNVELDKYPWGP